jgi:DNA-binding NarL/FixJ family response regulator
MIVSEVCFLRECLAAALLRYPIIDLKAQAGSAEWPRIAQEIQPAVLLLDVAFPDALNAVASFAALAPKCAVVALAIAESEQNVLAWVEAGAAGYVPNTASVEELVGRLEQIARGEQTCTPQVSGSLMRRVATSASRNVCSTVSHSLTPREAEILGLVRKGLSNKEIARRLCISVGTTKSHVHSLLSKLGLERRAETVGAFAWPNRNRSFG